MIKAKRMEVAGDEVGRDYGTEAWSLGWEEEDYWRGGVTVVREKHEIVSLGIVSSSIRRIEYGRSSCAGGGGMVIARPTLP